MATTINYEKHIWEGWTVKDFIESLELQFDAFSYNLKTKDEIKRWCMDNQPYYKKYIPDVVKHFIKQKENELGKAIL
jgi:hypothetical protein